MVVKALIVSHELIRVAILWHELWHEGLEEASRLYFTDRNPEGMIAFLEPLHDKLEAVSYNYPYSHRISSFNHIQGPKTARETSFAQTFGRDLYEARQACHRYREYNEQKDLDRAWEIYYSVSSSS